MKRGKFERFMGTDGLYYFRLKAGNHEIIATSEGYITAQSRDKGISAVRRVALFAR